MSLESAPSIRSWAWLLQHSSLPRSHHLFEQLTSPCGPPPGQTPHLTSAAAPSVPPDLQPEGGGSSSQSLLPSPSLLCCNNLIWPHSLLPVLTPPSTRVGVTFSWHLLACSSWCVGPRHTNPLAKPQFCPYWRCQVTQPTLQLRIGNCWINSTHVSILCSIYINFDPDCLAGHGQSGPKYWQFGTGVASNCSINTSI